MCYCIGSINKKEIQMNELSTLTFGFLLGLLALYLIVFWGIGIASVVVSYLHDGQKDFSAFYESKKWEAVGMSDRGGVLLFGGFLAPIFWVVFMLLLVVIDGESGLPISFYIIAITAGSYTVMRIARAVIRLGKRLAAHESDKGAHK